MFIRLRDARRPLQPQPRLAWSLMVGSLVAYGLLLVSTFGQGHPLTTEQWAGVGALTFMEFIALSVLIVASWRQSHSLRH